MKSLVFAAFALAGTLLFFSATAPSGYIVGDKADDFSLQNVDGSIVSLKSAAYKDVKGYIVIFTCNHCPYAQMYEERIIALHKKYKPKGYPVIAINPNSPIVVPEDSFEEMKKRSSLMKYPYVYLFDEEQEVYPKFGASRTPHVFILDTSLIVRYIGAIDDNPELASMAKNHWVENALETMLRGGAPNPDYTIAIGCTVKKKPEVSKK